MTKILNIENIYLIILAKLFSNLAVLNE